MNLSKSIDFLLENAGAVIQYRLRKEILCNLTKVDEENLLEQIYQTTNFKLVESYVKSNGYIGSGAHSWGKWRGVVYQQTYLADGEACARLLSNYAVPKTHPLIPGWAFGRPIKPFVNDKVETVMYRRPLTEIAMLGVGENVDILRESATNICEAISSDGILQTKYKKSSFSKYPTAYVDIILESDHKRKYALECDMTFWAVQFLYLCNNSVL